jgi:hypothetical protein
LGRHQITRRIVFLSFEVNPFRGRLDGSVCLLHGCRLAVRNKYVSVANGGAAPHCRGLPLQLLAEASSRQRNELRSVMIICVRDLTRPIFLSISPP